MASKGTGASLLWILQQHDDFKLVEGREAPSTKVEAGERMKAVFGPYASKADAEAAMRSMEARTLRGKREGK